MELTIQSIGGETFEITIDPEITSTLQKLIEAIRSAKSIPPAFGLTLAHQEAGGQLLNEKDKADSLCNYGIKDGMVLLLTKTPPDPVKYCLTCLHEYCGEESDPVGLDCWSGMGGLCGPGFEYGDSCCACYKAQKEKDRAAVDKVIQTFENAEAKDIDARLTEDSNAVLERSLSDLCNATSMSDLTALDSSFVEQTKALRQAAKKKTKYSFDDFIKKHKTELPDGGQVQKHRRRLIDTCGGGFFVNDGPTFVEWRRELGEQTKKINDQSAPKDEAKAPTAKEVSPEAKVEAPEAKK